VADAETGSGRAEGEPEAPAPAPGSGSSAAGKAAPSKRAAKKSAGKQGTAKKTTAKKTTAKKTTAKKATAKKATAKKTTAKKTTGKKATGKKTTAKKTTAKKATAERTTPTPPSPAPPRPAPETPEVRAAAGSGEPASASPADDRPKAAGRVRQAPPDPATADLPWLESYPPLVPPSYPYPEVALTRLLDDAAKDFPESTATEFAGRTLTYRRLLDQVDRFATALHALGIGAGDRVGVALPNCPQQVIAVFGILRAGAVVVEHDHTADEDVLAYEIDTAGCRAVVISDPVYAKIGALKGRLASLEHVIATSPAEFLPPLAARVFAVRHRNDPTRVYRIAAEEGVLRFTELIRRHPPTAPQAHTAPRHDLALLAFEPDTRERRAVMLTHHNLIANVFQIRLWIPDMQAGREILLCTAPFSEPFGLVTGMCLALLSAATMSLLMESDPAQTLAAIARRKPTIWPTSAARVAELAGLSQLRKVDLQSLRAVLCHGSELEADQAREFESATGGRVRTCLSILRATGVTHANPIYGKIRADRVGLPLTDTVCTVVDRDGAVVDQGRPGELLIHGPQVMHGFWNHPADTARVLEGGWLRTGLLAEIDAEGYAAVLGRVPSS
jgi:long-chain acyl-CoA synthetase